MTKGKTPADPVDYLTLGGVVCAVAGIVFAISAAGAGSVVLAVSVVVGAVGAVVLGIGIVGVGVKIGLAHHEWTRPVTPRERQEMQ